MYGVPFGSEVSNPTLDVKPSDVGHPVIRCAKTDRAGLQPSASLVSVTWALPQAGIERAVGPEVSNPMSDAKPSDMGHPVFVLTWEPMSQDRDMGHPQKQKQVLRLRLRMTSPQG